MKKVFLILAVCLSTVVSVVAENEKDERTSENLALTTNVSGVVIDKITGEALVGVAVELAGTNMVAYTDFEGNFEIKGVSPGNHIMNISYISYGDENMPIEIKCNKTNKIKIEIADTEN
ncbi:MAG: hypothetical protein A2W98_01780 [Bacteroidetes bacterium GWF2_33_38]|nr:MAG: hypothetical protein A2W98_01780 [Bacteroidetes bacterium GWF2_33_38]OFY76057.1 MAG: hypothetical protein A2265_07080 [Bacteroidetes bacterium RIFOXYA12_FULL_33_9]OFY90019.1 MAG: hypothetical protein A2236_11750 [Bacteroidetes bacterium RIFOXYA2_FULL_33_7]